MKQRIPSILLTALLCLTGFKVFAHDIEVANSDGVTIYYTYQNNNTELVVSFCGRWSSEYQNEYTGNVVIPESVIYDENTYPVTSIGNAAFCGCSGLTSITIPSSVTSIGNNAFTDCSGLTDFYCYVEEPPTAQTSTFNSSAIRDATLHVPAASVTAYQTTAPWSGFKEVMAMEEKGINSITLIESQQTENQDMAYWNGDEMVFPTGYENFDKQLNFCYVVEKGIISDTKGTVKEAEWNYPESLIKQLPGIQNPRAVHYADDYNYKYDGVSFTALENGTGYDFVDGRYCSFEDSILVRISPANADLSKAEITLLNNKGENIVDAGLIQVLDVTAEGSETGLWVIKFKLNDENVGTLYEKYAHSTAGDILYAVAVKNTDSSNSEGSESGNASYVVSDYELSLNQKPIKHVWDFNVNGVSIAEIHNRYIHAGESTNGTTRWTDDPITPGNKSMFRYELAWKDLCANDVLDTTSAEGREAEDDFDCWDKIGYTTILFDSATDGYEDEPYACGINTVDRYMYFFDKTTGVRYMEDGVDNRQKCDFLPVFFSEDQAPEGETGEWAKIEIEFPSFNACDERTPIRGFFVTMDQHYAIESDNSEINGWPVYITKNIAKYPYGNGRVKSDEQAFLDLFEQAITLQKGNKGSVWVKLARNLSYGDVLGFRVHAVNLDGTLTDPDGRAFYVKVAGNEKLTFNIQADTLESYAVSNCNVTLNPSDNYKIELSWRGKNPAIRATGTGTEAYMPVAGTNGPLRVEDFFDFQLPTDGGATMRAAIRSGVANRLIDGATYKVTMTMQRQDGENVWTMVNSYDIDITKVMPTAMPAEFGFRPLQLDNGVWPFYLRPYAGVEYGETATDSPWKIFWNDGDGHASTEHNCRWGVDVRPFDFKELFTGMILPEEYKIDKNYYFVFKESGDFAAADVDATEASDEQYKDADAIAVYTEDVDGGCYQLPKIHWSHVGESKNVEAGYIYRGISAKLDDAGEKFLKPQDEQANSKILNIKNQDYVIAPVPVMAGSKQFVASFSCAFDAAVVMAADATENAFAYNADVFVNATDATFKLKNIAWYASGNYQAYFNTQFPASWTDAEGGVGTLADVIADSYFWVDMTSLKCNVASPDGFNYQDFYYNPYFAKSDGTKAKTFNEIVNIVMSRRAAPERIWDFNSDVEGTFTFNIYDIWFHRRTVTVSFKIKKPVSSDGETDELQRYLNSLTDTEDELTANVYKRTFRNGDWQALYVPFEMDYSDWSDKFEVARVSGFRSSSAGLEGGVLEATMVESGKVEANYPYLIRAKSKYGATLTVNVTGNVSMTSGTTAFAPATVIGNYEKMYKMNTYKRYRLQGGSLSIPNSDNEMLPPFRWYARGPENQASRLTIEVNGVATDITSCPATIDDRSLRVYNLSGNRVGVMRSEELNLLPKGVYIINGRKYTVK